MAGAGRPPPLLIGGGDRTLDTRSPQKTRSRGPGSGTPDYRQADRADVRLDEGKTGAAARRGPMSARSRVRLLANRDVAGWVRDRRDVEASAPAVTKPQEGGGSAGHTSGVPRDRSQREVVFSMKPSGREATVIYTTAAVARGEVHTASCLARSASRHVRSRAR